MYTVFIFSRRNMRYMYLIEFSGATAASLGITSITSKFPCIGAQKRSRVKRIVRDGSRCLFSTAATFPTKPCKLHHLESGPATEVSVTKNEAIKLYGDMVMIRHLEDVINTLYDEKYIHGWCHSYCGQEACGVGMEAAIRKTDVVIVSYRTHGWAYLRGIHLNGLLAELTGRELGCARGKGGSMHIYSTNFLGGHGIVGAQVPLGTGAAFASTYLGKDDLSLALYGDGAANQGQVFESFNMAKLWNLPVIFVCENNGYGITTRAERSSASTNYYARGDYVPGLCVDGMDVLAVREATRFAADLCRAGKGPLVLELVTYRFHGHTTRDGKNYRPIEEVQEYQRKRDPISSFKEKIIAAGLVQDEELEEIGEKMRKEVAESAAAAKSAKEIPSEELYADIYMDPINTKIRGITPFTEHHHKRITQPLFM